MSRCVFLLCSLALTCSLACGNDAPSRTPARTPSKDAGSDRPKPDEDEQPDDAPQAELGKRAVAELTFIGGEAQDEDGDGVPNELTGKATFEVTRGGVDLGVALTGCVGNRSYPVRILEASDCDDVTGASEPWKRRGEGITRAACVTGRSDHHYRRKSGGDDGWTLGAPRASDVIGRTVVVYSPGDEPLACGVVEEAEPVDPSEPDAIDGPSVEVQAFVGGICATRLIARSTTHECPKPAEYAACAAENCALADCLEACSEYASCIEGEEDACETSCPQSDDCAACQMETFACVLNKCMDVVSCAAPPTPGGPCDKVRACCMEQGDRAGFCLDLLDQVENLSGDPSCEGLLMDMDFLENIANDPPCMPE